MLDKMHSQSPSYFQQKHKFMKDKWQPDDSLAQSSFHSTKNNKKINNKNRGQHSATNATLYMSHNQNKCIFREMQFNANKNTFY